MTLCKDCKHYAKRQPEDTDGWCGIELPAWLYRAVGTNSMSVNNDVTDLDYCDLGEEKK